MNKKTLRDIDVKARRVLVRVDFNVPLENGKVADDTRIRAALPTIQHVLDQGGSLVLMSHLGRPEGKVLPEASLKPVADRLQAILGKDVMFVKDCVGDAVKAAASALKPGDLLLLENLRYHPEEEGKGVEKSEQEAFARELAELGDVYVNDAFGTAHRAHASTAVVAQFMAECAAGFLMEKEIEYLSNAVEAPAKPFVALIGGAKISGKIDVLTNLVGKVDAIVVGGAMAYTFYRAKGIPVGDSKVEEDKIEVARDTMAKLEEAGVRFLLPVDHVVADQFSENAVTKIVDEACIEDGWMALDIGPKSIELFSGEIKGAKTVVWNGPMGCFEMAPFAEGTMSMVRAVAQSECVSIIGGGDSASAVNKSGLADKMSHISTGGGASLELLEGKVLPGLAALSDT